MESNSDSPSSGERTGTSLNRVYVSLQALYARGCGAFLGELQLIQGVTKSTGSRTLWKGRPKKVTVLYAKSVDLPKLSPSTAGHVKPGGNLGGPSSKAKYYSTTDSERVP